MKVYVLTHCAAEENYTPDVFITMEAAKEEMQYKLYNTIVNIEYDATVDDKPKLYYKDEPVYSYVEDYDEYEDGFKITYIDDTYDVVQLFEVEVIDA